ncbi:MAG: hypothetical protein KHZ77_07825 [Veillonella sp.]|uniref:vWA domain-containing protein n=1 Tax=Veillonella sp. TaxID=1926307 RepID=UPI0025F87AB8|nr:VWA-like domain-containing protein [Veillonella sp.]MBS4914041.1 hypothetical protein [Veillonella sp.]
MKENKIEATRLELLDLTKKLVAAWKIERDAKQREQEIKDNAYTNSLGYAITEAAALAAGNRDLKAGTAEFVVDGDYEKRFFKLVSQLNLLLLEEDSFYGYFFLQVGQELRFSMTSATGINFKGSGYVMYFNPIIFLDMTAEQMMSSIKHEILHVISLHLVRAKRLYKRYSPLAINLAMDIVVNNYISPLPPDAIDVNWLNKHFGTRVVAFKPLEYYVDEIQAHIDVARETEGATELGDTTSDEAMSSIVAETFNAARSHDIWSESDNVDGDSQQQLTNKMVESSEKGDIAGYLTGLLSDFKKHQTTMSWSIYLKRLIGSISAGYRKTTTRRSRRQPERLELRGELRRRRANIVVALDCSGSISDSAFRQAMLEVLEITRNYDFEITVVECDSVIRRTYTVKKLKDVKPRVQARGSTLFSPVIDFANTEQADLLVYFTDGKGEKKLDPIPKHYKILWVLVGAEAQLSVENPWGLVKQVGFIEEEEDVMVDDERVDGYSMNNQEGFSMANQEKTW